jgi:sugar phosphate isomerase/epimerase
MEEPMFRNFNPSALGIIGHPSEIIELALSYGFQGVDLAIEESVHTVKGYGVPYARRLLESARLRAGVFHLPMDLEAEDAVFQQGLGKLAEYGEVAAAMGCTRCVTRLVPASDQLPYHENFERYRRRLGEACQTLDRSGVRLGVGFRAAADLRRGKTFEFIHDPEALLLLVNMVGASNLGILLDGWSLYVATGSLDLVQSLSAEQIVAVDLADLPEDVATTELSEAARLLPGVTGRVDSAATLAMLAEKGYDGPVTPTPARVTLGNAKRDGIVREAGQALMAVWQAAGLPTGARQPAGTRR